MYVFGQFVDHDLSLELNLTTTDPIPIPVPNGDPIFAQGTQIAMTRDVRDPKSNTIVNTTAGYLDLSQLYGSTDAISNSLRNNDGSLKSSSNGQALPIVNGAFISGDPRVMENPELVAVTTLFMREHNYWAKILATQHPNWSGGAIYDLAKAITTAEYQNIVYEEYLPMLIGPVLGPYHGYNPAVNAQVTQEFTTAAFRAGHSQVSGQQDGIDNNGNIVFSQSLADAFFNSSAQDLANGIDPLLRGISTDSSQAVDACAVPEIRNLLFAGLVGGEVDQMDLIAIDIQRGRDVGLGLLNQTRRALWLPPYRSFAELTSDFVLQRNFADLYGSIDNVDLFMGGLAERHVDGSELGRTFQTIVAWQFDNLRTGDRFFWENQDFDTQTRWMIKRTTLAQLIRRNTDTIHLQDWVFRIPAKQPRP